MSFRRLIYTLSICLGLWAHAQNPPERIYVLVPEQLPDGPGDIALNIKFAEMIGDYYAYAQTEVVLIIPESSQVQTSKFLGKLSYNFKTLYLPFKEELPPADFLFSFSQHANHFEIPDRILSAAEHHFIFKEDAEDAFYVNTRKSKPAFNIKELESWLISHGYKNSVGLSEAKIAFAYSYNQAPSQAYMWAIAREAATNPNKNLFLFIREQSAAQAFESEIPSNLKLIHYNDLPLPVFESAIAHCHYPALVTGSASLNAALEFDKPVIYEMRSHKNQMWDRLVKILTGNILNEEIKGELRHRAIPTGGLRTVINSGLESEYMYTRHGNLVSYIQRQLHLEFVNRIFTTPQNKLRINYSLLLQSLRMIQTAYSLERRIPSQNVRPENQKAIVILSSRDSHSESISAFLESMHVRLLRNEFTQFDADFEDLITAVELSDADGIKLPSNFADDFLKFLSLQIKLSVERDVVNLWKTRLMRLTKTRNSRELSSLVSRAWEDHPKLIPSQAEIKSLLGAHNKASLDRHIQKSPHWITRAAKLCLFWLRSN